MRKIQIVPIGRKEEFRKYFYEYLTELSQFDPDIEFLENGTPIYNWFDCYWEDKDRFPLFLVVNEVVAGISMIREMDDRHYDIAEFYVCPKFRKDGNALWFATEITNLFDGQFDFSTRFTNPRAIKFWEKFASMFEIYSVNDDEIWRNWKIRTNKKSSHKLNLQEKYFNLIASGEKVYEGRLNDEKRKLINIGDEIIFYKEPEKVETMKAVVLDRWTFKTFDDMADALDKSKLGFKNNSKQEMIDVYRKIYNLEREQKYGVVIFHIKVIND